MRPSFFFLLFFLILLTACVDTYEALPETVDQEIYQPYRGTIEMVGENAFRLGGSNSLEIDSDMEILMLIEKRIIFKSEEFVFDLDESNIYGADPCGTYGAHCVGDSDNKRLVFEPDTNFWECFFEANCDPRDEVIWFELFVRKPV